MSMLIVEQLAKHLDLSTEDVSSAFSELVVQMNTELERDQTSHLPGLGTFTVTDDKLSFKADEALSLAVNNRFGSLDPEMVSFGLDTPDFGLSSEGMPEGNENELDQTLIDQILSDDISETNTFSEPLNSETNAFSEPLKEESDTTLQDDVDLIASFDEDFFSADTNQTEIPSPNTSDAETSQDSSAEDVSMKEEDLNSSNHSEQESNEFDTEWSPFFEELEGEEFDIDSTIDLSAEDWQSEIPAPPPSSPFASSSSDSAEGNADDLYFDVDADPDDTLFSPASMDVDDPSTNDSTWASTPMLDESTDFFEDDPSVSSSFGDGTEPLASLSAEDEFFSPVTGSVSATPEDTLFSAETIYSEDATVEADDTIFLAPDQTVDPNDQTVSDMYAPPAGGAAAATKLSDDRPPEEPPKSRNPYAYREDRRKRTSAWPWVAGTLILLLAGAGFGAYKMGLLPFGSQGTTEGETPIAVADPPPVSNDPQVQSDPVATEDPVVNDPPATTSTPPPAVQTPPQTPPAAQRIGIDRAQGGWTIVVSSELQRSDAERIANNFAQKFEALRFPIDILTTNEFANVRHRVGVGQFGSRQEANAILGKFDMDLPQDAWLLRIE